MAEKYRTPSSQEIKDMDIHVDNELRRLARLADQDAQAAVLACGLSAIHERLGDMFIWMRGRS